MTGTDKVLSFVKDVALSWQLSAVLAIASMSVLFCPAAMCERLGVAHLQAEYRVWLGLTLILSLSGLLVKLAQLSHFAWVRKRTIRATIKRLAYLSLPERRILAFCVINGQQSIHLPITLGFAKSLVSKGLLSPSGGHGNRELWAHNIPDNVWAALRTGGLEWGFEKGIEEEAGNPWFKFLLRGQAVDQMWEDDGEELMLRR